MTRWAPTDTIQNNLVLKSSLENFQSKHIKKVKEEMEYFHINKITKYEMVV